MEKPKVGDVLYSLNVGNARGRHSTVALTPVEVVSVGRKYFYTRVVDGRIEDRYEIVNWRQDTEGYSETSKLYADPQDWNDEVRARGICKTMWASFGYGKNIKELPLSVLMELEEIVERA